MEKFLSTLLILSLMLLIGCQAGEKTFTTQAADAVTVEDAEGILSQTGTYVIINVKDQGTIIVKMSPDTAPISVQNFTKLSDENFYDGVIFHRVISGFMIQGGDPTGVGDGGSDKNIKGEFAANGVENALSHKRGVISMARSDDPDSASSQFFIVHQDSDFLDGNYAAFGEVVSGMEIVDAIANTETDASDRPIDEQVIESTKVIVVD